MSARTWMRLGSLSWLPYLVLGVIAFALLPKPMPANDADVQALSAYFGAHGAAVRAYVALGSVANLFLLLFVTYLATRLCGSSELSALSSRLILASGTAAVITEYAVLAAQWAATTPGTVALSPLFEGFVGVGMYAFALFIGTVGVGSLVMGILPRWFGWLSVLAGVTELLVPVLITLGMAQASVISFALVALWIPVAGIISSRYERRAPLATESARGGTAANAEAT